MSETKNLCAKIPLALYTQVNEAKAQVGQTTNEYITSLLTEYFEMKRNGGNITMTGNSRTMAFQVPEELFQTRLTPMRKRNCLRRRTEPPQARVAPRVASLPETAPVSTAKRPSRYNDPCGPQ